MIYGISYAATIIPSIFGIPVQVFLRAVMIIYDLNDAKVREDDKTRWSRTKALYGIFYYVLSPMLHTLIGLIIPVCQTIPFINWVLNLIPIALSHRLLFPHLWP